MQPAEVCCEACNALTCPRSGASNPQQSAASSKQPRWIQPRKAADMVRVDQALGKQLPCVWVECHLGRVPEAAETV